MLLTFVPIIIYCLISFFIKDIVMNLEFIAILFIAVNSIFVPIFLAMSIKVREYYLLSICGYILRLAALLWDIYARGVFLLPHSGGDTEGFYMEGIAIANDFTLFGKTPMGEYSNLLGLIFRIVGDQRIFAQYINVLLGVGSIVIIYKIIKVLGFSRSTKRLIMGLIIFFPQAIIFSGILLRESIVSFGIITMMYYFIKWYKYKGTTNIVLSLMYLAIATYFHSGAIGALAPLVYMYAFYQHKTKKLKTNIKSLIVFSCFSILIAIVYVRFGAIFLSKFGGTIDLTSERIYKTIEVAGIDAGSRYLQWIKYDSIFDIVIFSPLKMFYFLFSPIPLDWRGSMDFITFIMDSSIYLIMWMYIIKNMKTLKRETHIINVLIIMFLIITFIFSYGTIATGTAVRHRNKIYGLLVIILGLVKENKTIYDNKNHIKMKV